MLGSFEVSAGRTGVLVPQGHQRGLLTALLLAEGRPVRVDDLARRLWGDQPPERVRGTLSTYVTRLRRLLGDELVVSCPGGGYAVPVDGVGVDLHRFRDLVRRAGEARAEERELGLLREALGLWRGLPFTGVESDWLEREIVPALAEEWWAVTERRVDLDLARGGATELVAELRGLTTRHPLREPLWLRLIDALRRSGRRADALTAYAQVRTLLRDDLGVEPGEELQLLHQDLLREVRVCGSRGPHQLPHADAGFAGRRADIEALDRLVADVGRGASGPTITVTVDGALGTGKTALAVHWAHRVAGRYPDVQLYLDLHGFSAHDPVGPACAVETLLRSLDVPAHRIPAGLDERSALLRSRLAGRRCLVLLDNARDAEQVRPLLPGAGSLVVVTSRDQLRSLSIRDGARRHTLGRLDRDDAVEVLSAAVGTDRVAAEPEAAERLTGLCDRLPLALAIAAERVQRAGSLGEVVRSLADGGGLLDDSATGNDLRAALSWSCRSLEPPAAAVFRTLGLHPANDIGLDSVAALADLPVARAKRLLDQLVDVHLVEQGRSGRYELYDLVRRYAKEYWAASGESAVTTS